MKKEIKMQAYEIDQKIGILETLYDKELEFDLSLKMSEILEELLPKKEWYTKQMKSIYDICLAKDKNGDFIPVFNNKDNPKEVTGYKVLKDKESEIREKIEKLNKTEILLHCSPILLSEFKEGIGKNQIKPKDLYNLRTSFIIDDKDLEDND